jgi:hypothetical protein
VAALCDAVHDVAVTVRAELFCQLGRMGDASEMILLQAFEKKSVGTGVQGTFQGRPRPGQQPPRVRARLVAEEPPLAAAGPCGAIVHGFEDDDYGAPVGMADRRGPGCSHHGHAAAGAGAADCGGGGA